MAGWIILDEPFLVKAGYDLLWSLSVTDEDCLFYDFFFTEMGLAVEDLELMPDVFVECVVWDTTAQIELLAWLSLVDTSLPVDCKYTTGIFSLP